MKSVPGFYGAVEAAEAEEKLRKVIQGMRDRRYPSVYKRKMRKKARAKK